MFSALGAGKLDNDLNQLMQAPEVEEEFDVLNDETFGDLEDVHYDWEDQHKRMAEELEGSSFFETPMEENQTGDSGFITMDRGILGSVSGPEEMLEQSIRRLVVDDSDNKAFTLTGQPIPGALPRSHLDELFGPNSPPNYLEMDALKSLFVSQGSPAGKNIWGSPSTDTPLPAVQKPINNTLAAMFASAKQAALRDFPGVFGDAALAPMAGPPLPLPAEACTLAEIEHSMMARESQKPRVLTAAELERQLRGEPPLPQEPRPSQMPHPAHIPPAGTSVSFRKPTHGPMSMMSNQESSPINIVRPSGNGMPVFHGQESPAHYGRSPSPSHSHPPPPHLVMAQSPRLMSPYNTAAIMMANRMLGQPMMRPSPPTHIPPPGMNNSPFNSPYGSPSPHTVMANSRLPHGPPPMFDQSPPKPGPPHHNVPYGAPHMQFQYQRGPSRNHSGNHPGNYGNQHHNDRRDYYNQRNFNQHRHIEMPLEPDRENEDPYAGLMTRKEKDWIIKIQLIQLQTDNPYLDDYYYTYHTMRKKMAERDKAVRDSQMERGSGEPELIIPNMMKIEPRTYTPACFIPAQFEGSLGRLTAASVHNPRQIIDVCRNNSPTGEEQGKKSISKDLRRYRQLLMDIEKCFLHILDVDDIEKKILALPQENRLPLFEERRDKIQTVYNYFMQDDNLKFKNFVPVLSVRKGRKLLARLMALTDKIQSLDLVTVLLSHLPLLLRKDDGEGEGLLACLGPVARHMAQCDLEFLAHYAAILQREPDHNDEGVAVLLQNKFGMSLVLAMIKAGEDYFKKTSPVDIDNQLKTKWTTFIEEFVEAVQSVAEDKLASPTSKHPHLAPHVQRFTNNKIFGSIEDKLTHLAEPGTLATQLKVTSKPIPTS